MSQPATPPEILAFAEKLKASMPGLPRDFLPQRAAGMKVFTVDEALMWFEKMAQAITGSSRMPITAETARNPDGSLTIRVTPTG